MTLAAIFGYENPVQFGKWKSRLDTSLARRGADFGLVDPLPASRLYLVRDGIAGEDSPRGSDLE